ncbi:VOC family protein [Burkholderia sp. Bp9015]|uniref:VOC family protein n=1 Tax=Burkholderia sp. Bp9015 TaxID=2184563 RepID=UPI000F59F4D7|nr:VOC family protein [Burkholderia sp. Bp9015]RQR74794.1 glyoxalase [Burkholderia sp. Bp9015]
MRVGLNFSHVGLYVLDPGRMERFYHDVLGFTVTDRGRLPGADGWVDLVFLSRDPDEHHQVVLATGRPNGEHFNVINQISFRADSLKTLCAFYRRLVDLDMQEIKPVTHGNAISLYVRDPEGNRLELFTDTPWYVSQPMKVDIDLCQPEDVLMQQVETHARSLPGFEARSTWRARMAQRMEEDATR